VDARVRHEGLSLAQMYSSAMPADLALAHAAVDRAVDAVFRPSGMFTSEEERALVLFQSYAAMTA
jgi:hypothetical protein